MYKQIVNLFKQKYNLFEQIVICLNKLTICLNKLVICSNKLTIFVCTYRPSEKYFFRMSSAGLRTLTYDLQELTMRYAC